MPSPIHTLDLQFQGAPRAIAAYLIPHAHGGVLVECGPGSTTENLTAALAEHSLTPADITDVLVTHIHLDHAGAAGWMARQGARIHVHHVGAPHLINPEKLLRSAGRIYGETMDALWGEFLPVPEAQINILHDNDAIEIEGLVFHALDTPGHAYHHMAYLFEGICFSGDVGGVRINAVAARHIRLPTPPPEFHLERWRASLARLAGEDIQRIAPTHFGVFADPQEHLAALDRALQEIEQWMENHLPGEPEVKTLENEITRWEQERARADGLTEEDLAIYESASPAWMSAAGLLRYWNKYRIPHE